MAKSCTGLLARVFLGVLLLGTSGLSAQGTGSMEGIVLDLAERPIRNAQVFVIGTPFGGLTDHEGNFAIDDVPAGVYSMRAQFIGYKPGRIENVRVVANQSVYFEFRLAPRRGTGDSRDGISARAPNPSHLDADEVELETTPGPRSQTLTHS